MERHKHDNVLDWRHWERDESQQHKLLWIGREGNDAARYKVQINSAEPALVFIAFDDKAYPLCSGTGLMEIEFAMTGQFALRCESDADVWFYTIAAEETHFEGDGAAPFTRYHEPALRDPVMDKIVAKMTHNMNVLFAQTQQLHEKELQEAKAANGKPAPVKAPPRKKDGKPDGAEQVGDGNDKPEGQKPPAGQAPNDDAGSGGK